MLANGVDLMDLRGGRRVEVAFDGVEIPSDNIKERGGLPGTVGRRHNRRRQGFNPTCKHTLPRFISVVLMSVNPAISNMPLTSCGDAKAPIDVRRY